jgi:hypothetical protein
MWCSRRSLHLWYVAGSYFSSPITTYHSFLYFAISQCFVCIWMSELYELSWREMSVTELKLISECAVSNIFPYSGKLCHINKYSFGCLSDIFIYCDTYRVLWITLYAERMVEIIIQDKEWYSAFGDVDSLWCGCPGLSSASCIFDMGWQIVWYIFVFSSSEKLNNPMSLFAHVSKERSRYLDFLIITDFLRWTRMFLGASEDKKMSQRKRLMVSYFSFFV